jgi:hypothetical protein
VTTINATEAELRAIAEVLKLAAILDDRAPTADRARIIAWAEQIHRHALGRSDLLDGLQLYYDAPSERAIQIGDLIDRGRQARRARLDKEADAQREARQDDLTAKAADEMRNLMGGAVFGETPRTPRLIAAETALQVCTNRAEAHHAIREFFAAKTEAKKAEANA